MSNWQEALQRALHEGNPETMKAALREVPEDVLHVAAPYMAQMAEQCERDGNLEEARTYLDQLVAVEPDEVRWRLRRSRVNVRLDEQQAVVDDALRLIELQPGDSTGYRLLAEAHDGLRARRAALDAYAKLRVLEPGDEKVAARIEYLQQQLRREEMVQNVLDPASATESRVEVQLPRVEFDPALLVDPSMPVDINPAMVAGLVQHLRHYGTHNSSRNTLDRLDDPQWLQAWDAALQATAGGRVLLHGSELGVLAVRALMHGAAQVTVVEPSPIDARIASGVIQKYLIGAWHDQHGADVQQWSEEERRSSFDEFVRNVEVLPPDAESLQPASYDWLVVTNVDHTLLGTGVAHTIRGYLERAPNLRVLPRRARAHALAVQWAYPGTELDLNALSSLRWSAYPQVLDLADRCWTALTEVVEIADFELAEGCTQRRFELPVIASGCVDAIVFWFDIDLGAATLHTGPEGLVKCLRPAVQYVDPVDVQAGGTLPLDVHADASRLRIATVPRTQQLRIGALPGWYVHMIVDEPRNAAYRAALRERLADRHQATVLDIGAGSGLLSMMAAQLGAAEVYACEIDRPLADVAARVAAANDDGDRVRVVTRDCRRMTVPDDMPRRADLAVFELFDCSLIGEGVLHYLAHAREHLLTEQPVYVPMSGRLRAQVIEYRLESLLDVDVNILNPYRFSAEFINVDASRLAYRPLSEPFDVFAFDFADAAPTPQDREFELVANAAGTAGAVLFWFDLQLTPEQWLSNAPDAAEPLHWKQGLQFLPEVLLQSGMQLPLTARHNGSALQFRWKPDALPAEAHSKLPRFDPRVFQQATELQAQTANLLRHCMSDPDEYRRVAELAQRLAVDPAAHGLDPKIAQRFAARFMGGRV